MVTLTIDFNNIIKIHNLENIKKRVSPIPISKLKLGLILLIPSEQLKILNSQPKGDKRVQYINTLQFINFIQGYAYTTYDDKKNVCELLRKQNIKMEQIVRELIGVFPNNSLIWDSIPIKSLKFKTITQEYIKAGFSDPHISKLTPEGHKLGSYALCMIKVNNNRTQTNNITNQIKYVLEEFARNIKPCQMKVSLTNDSIIFMRDLQRMGGTLNSDGTITQKEIAGNLRCEKVSDNLVHQLSIDHASLITGKEQGVPIVPGLYNFHSHPAEAYEANNVKVGWPSAQDFLGFLRAFIEDNTILHMVASIEGLYVISMNRYWLLNKNKIDKGVGTFILEKYNFCGVKGLTPVYYTQLINKISIKGYPLFVVQYTPWHEADSIFRVEYVKDNKVNCFTRDKTYKYYNRLYTL